MSAYRFMTRRAFGQGAAAGLAALGGGLSGSVLAQTDGAARLDPESAALNDLLAGETVRPLYTQTIRGVRDGIADAGRLMQSVPVEVASVTDTTVPGSIHIVPARLYRPAGDDGSAQLPIVLYFHGGFFVAGSIDTHDHMARRLANACGALVVSIGYRLAPEDPYPAGLDDCTEALRWVSNQGRALGGDPSRIALAGDDTGGALAAGVAIRARSIGIPGLRFMALLTPLLRVTGARTLDTHLAFGEGGYRPSLRDIQWMVDKYRGEPEITVGPLSPLDVSGLDEMPETLVISAGFDALRDEGGFFVRRLRESGVTAGERIFPTTIHDFMFYPDILLPARTAYDVVGAQFRLVMG